MRKNVNQVRKGKKGKERKERERKGRQGMEGKGDQYLRVLSVCLEENIVDNLYFLRKVHSCREKKIMRDREETSKGEEGRVKG